MGEAVEDLLVSSNEAFKGGHELFVGFDSLNLEEEAIYEDLVHACALSSSDDLGLVGKILGESDRRLLVHDIMIARCHDEVSISGLNRRLERGAGQGGCC